MVRARVCVCVMHFDVTATVESTVSLQCREGPSSCLWSESFYSTASDPSCVTQEVKNLHGIFFVYVLYATCVLEDILWLTSALSLSFECPMCVK